jgi:hypothetical protein
VESRRSRGGGGHNDANLTRCDASDAMRVFYLKIQNFGASAFFEFKNLFVLKNFAFSILLNEKKIQIAGIIFVDFQIVLKMA